jgi:hypothetical protein
VELTKVIIVGRLQPHLQKEFGLDENGWQVQTLPHLAWALMTREENGLKH